MRGEFFFFFFGVFGFCGEDGWLILSLSVVCCVRFSADGKYLATGCNRTAQIYDTKTGQKTWSVPPLFLSKVLTSKTRHRRICNLVLLIAFGQFFSFFTAFFYWHLPKQPSVLADDSAGKSGDLYIRSVCFSPDGKYLATGAEDKQIRVSFFYGFWIWGSVSFVGFYCCDCV